MNRLSKLAVIAALLFCPMRVRAQYQTVELAHVQLAKSLGATIEDPAGAPIRNAVVEEFDANWKTALRSGSTDTDGKFSFTPVTGQKVYFIQISAPGFDPLRFRLQIGSLHGARLKLKLRVAN